MSRIYLDHCATSPLRPEASRAILEVLAAPPGNPSSVHGQGHRARMAIESARSEVARLIGAEPREVVFTAGGTEANNLAVFGSALTVPAGSRRIVASDFEHPSVLEVLADLEERGFEIVRVRPDRSGVVTPAALLEAAEPGAALVCLMLANNEIGTLQPVAAVGPELRRRGILLHCDAAQAAGKVPIDVQILRVDTLALAAHKFGGPLGAGALYVRRGLILHRHLRGGGQEQNRRPGTENVAAIAGLGAAAAAAARGLEGEGRRMAALGDRLERAVLSRGLGARINGQGAPRVSGLSSIAFEGVSGEALVIALDLEGVAVSAGSACSAGTARRSRALEAMGLEAESRSSIRISLGPGTTEEEIDDFVGRLALVLSRIRAATTVRAPA